VEAVDVVEEDRQAEDNEQEHGQVVGHGR